MSGTEDTWQKHMGEPQKLELEMFLGKVDCSNSMKNVFKNHTKRFLKQKNLLTRKLLGYFS